MNESAFDFLEPLLKDTGLFDHITNSTQVPPICMNLDDFRNIGINFYSGDIRSWYYNLTTAHLPQAFEKKILFPKVDDRFKDKLIICMTNRYQNCFINYNDLKEFENDLVFIGLEKEHQLFCEKYFPIQYHKVKNGLEVAGLIEGSKGFIGNQSGIYTIAELLKVPRVLVTPEFIKDDMGNITIGPVNNHPRGGWYEVVQTQKRLHSSVKNLMDMRRYEEKSI